MTRFDTSIELKHNLCSNSTSSQPNINHLYFIEIFYHIQPQPLYISILYQNLIATS